MLRSPQLIQPAGENIDRGHVHNRLLRVALILGAVVTSACTSLVVDRTERLPIGYRVHVETPRFSKPAADRELSEQEVREGFLNRCRLQELYGEEWAARDSNEPPEFAIALSGGGLRSATFSLGTLSGLSAIGGDRGLDGVDLMSAVSGGGYAVSWYYAQHAHKWRQSDETILVQLQPRRLDDRQYLNALSHEREQARLSIDRELFQECHPGIDKDKCRYQNYLESHARIMGTFEGILLASFNLLTGAPLNIIANGLFGWHLNTNLARRAYENRLVRLFQTEPETLERKRVQFREIQRLVEDEGLPVVVFNTTAYIDDDRAHLGSRMRNVIYEFTPWHYGSDGLGYARHVPGKLDLARIATVSGGALDFLNTTAGNAQKIFASILNIDLGYAIDNPAFEPPGHSGGRSPMPCRERRSSCGLTVGCANTEGPAPWGRRIFHWIKPVPLYFSSDYAWHKGGLRLYLSDGGHSENLGAFSAIRRLPERLLIVDAEYDPQFRFGAYVRLRDAVRTEMGARLYIHDIEHILDGGTMRFERPYFKGYVGDFLFADAKGNVSPRRIEIDYLKLSIDEDHLDFYPPYVREYHWTNPEFPQQSTKDQVYDPAQFRAYRALGDCMLKLFSDGGSTETMFCTERDGERAVVARPPE